MCVNEDKGTLSRRQFVIGTTGVIFMGMTGRSEGSGASGTKKAPRKKNKTKVALVRTSDRANGIARAVDLLGINPVKGKKVLLKPNFNSADAYPGSTHNDTLVSLIKKLQAMGAGEITIGERSGPPRTSSVLKDKGIRELCSSLGAQLIDFEELAPEDWVRIRPENSHWRDGFDVARPVLESECIVSTCCLKTHGYGAVFTMSLKLSVGVTHKRNMTELHTSFRSMRKMIAEINQACIPSLIVMDGIEAFVDGGPMTGVRKRADVLVAGTDRIAVDAVGIAVLKALGSNEAVMGKKIFEQEQIARAVELGLGVSAPDEIELVSGDTESGAYADKLRMILEKG